MNRAIPLAVCCFVLAMSVSATVPAAASPTPVPLPGQQAVADEFLGFEVDEEYRYVIGPPESVYRGETGMWSIRLEEVYEGDDGPEGLFALRHEWQAPYVRGEVPLRSLQRVVSEGTLRVNAYGFPMHIWYKTTRHLAGLGDEGYSIEYELRDNNRGYRKHTTMMGRQWESNVGIRTHDTVDREGATGVFAFLPMAPGCMDRRVTSHQAMTAAPGTAPTSAGAPPSPMGQSGMPTTVRIAENADCEESMFANPGLLNLAMPALWEANGEREYVFFTPIGAVNAPSTQVSGSAGLPGVGSVGTGMPGSTTSRDPLRDASRASVGTGSYHEVETLKFLERVDVQIGSRTRGAWLIDLSNEYGPIYVDDDGRVMRIDLPTPEGMAQRYLRMLWPSEF